MFARECLSCTDNLAQLYIKSSLVLNPHSLKASQTYLAILGAVPSCYNPLSANNDRIEVINTHISHAKLADIVRTQHVGGHDRLK